MEILIKIVKVVTIAQIFLILVFLITVYVYKYYTHLRDKKNAEKTIQLNEMLSSHFDRKESFPQKSAQILKKSLNDVLRNLEGTKRSSSQNEYFSTYKKQLSDLVLQPIARKWATSRTWYKRFDATLCYMYSFEAKDEEKLLKLLNDPSILIAINAAEVVVTHNHRQLINEMITIFSKGRRLPQTLIVENISKLNNDISPIILERLEYEQHLYTRIFCYRLLTAFPQQTIAACAKKDLNYDSIDLKIVVINYLVHCEDDAKNELIYSLAYGPHWEVSSAVAKALGSIHTKTSIDLLSNLLHSSDWWVRQNAAFSLYKQGKEGIQVLQEQSLEQDKFAYESALLVLKEREKL
ncbi:MAG: HEAT repeat domain-containing protein [Tatlockia sp.]|nr:HEAT repeat domain-containing protein [Tatlockia sp.]